MMQQPLQLKFLQQQQLKHQKSFAELRPKIMKFKEGYSADAELMFRSWRTDILTHIQDQELDNKAAIQLIKDMTQDNAHHEVEFQLDLCGGIITYQDLLNTLHHLPRRQ